MSSEKFSREQLDKMASRVESDAGLVKLGSQYENVPGSDDPMLIATHAAKRTTYQEFQDEESKRANKLRNSIKQRLLERLEAEVVSDSRLKPLVDAIGFRDSNNYCFSCYRSERQDNILRIFLNDLENGLRDSVVANLTAGKYPFFEVKDGGQIEPHRGNVCYGTADFFRAVKKILDGAPGKVDVMDFNEEFKDTLDKAWREELGPGTESRGTA